jgi:2-iminobutanoate/2-iminopropanoate deaminase
VHSIQIVRSKDLPAPGGHYSHAVAHGGLLYVSGQLGRLAGMTDEQAGDIRAQTQRGLSAVEAIVRAGGADLTRILKINLYIADVALWPAANAQYADFMGAHRPARAVIPTGPLHHGALVEIDAIAAVG